MKKKWSKPVFTALKIAISIGLLYFVFSKIDWNLLQEEWEKANRFYLFLAFLSFVISQLFSVQRMGLFLREVEVPLSFVTNAKLYALGMFYNFFIPGGIGGDAYKVVVLKKQYKKSVKELTSAVFFDRFIGLCAIGILLCIGAFFLPLEYPDFFRYGILILGMGSIFIVPWILGKLFTRFQRIFTPTLLYSFVIQAFQIGTVWLSLLAVQPDANPFIYALIFLGSSVLSVVSFAGIGIRETFFYYAGEYLHFNPDLSAGIALIFSFITLITSLFGSIYLIKKIKWDEIS